MLSMLLLLVAAPQAATPPPPAPRAEATMRVLGQPLPGCRASTTPVTDPNAGNTLLWREGRDGVGHYLLLDRYVGGCPDPIVVNYRVPGSNAVGREVGREPAPVIVPRR